MAHCGMQLWHAAVACTVQCTNCCCLLTAAYYYSNVLDVHLLQASVVLAKSYATHAGCIDRIIFAGGFLQEGLCT